MTRARRATFKISSGPNKGDTLRVELGTCRLIGRHLSENETAFIDRDGNRMLDANTSSMLSEHLQTHDADAAAPAGDAENVGLNAFERGPDIILSDDAISRAHAMLFYDATGAVGVIDLASTNGTYVNDGRIVSQLLSHGDTVMLGGSALKVTLER